MFLLLKTTTTTTVEDYEVEDGSSLPSVLGLRQIGRSRVGGISEIGEGKQR